MFSHYFFLEKRISPMDLLPPAKRMKKELAACMAETRKKKLDPPRGPNSSVVTGVGTSITASGGDPFEKISDVHEFEILDELDQKQIEGNYIFHNAKAYDKT